MPALFALFALPAYAGVPKGLRDPEFERLQFAKWSTAAGQSHIKWSVETPPPELSTHQRLLIRAVIRIDGRELEKRRGEGEFVVLLQTTDSAGQVWQIHTSVDLATMQPYMQNRDLYITHYAFVLPGDYTLAIAVCDSRTLEHSLVTHRVHVDPVKDEPLPHAFDGLPTVEYVPPIDGTPDVWYLPGLEARLNLPVKTKRRVRLQVLVNATPSERSMGSAAALRRNMSLLIPALKVFSNLELSNGSVEVALLDLAHRKVVFEQEGGLDWYELRKFFTSTKAGIVDAQTLANEWKMRGYFMEELLRRLRAPLDDEVRVVIVLSGPAFLEDPSRLTWESEPPDPARQLFYIRYRTLPVRYPPRNRPGVRPVPQRPTTVNVPMLNDDLQSVAIALNGKVFDATSAEQFRRIFATILEQLARL
ncbi:MAG TPA: hypothetical protein VNH18_02260 [Bryobacteraceae bacterium]|nr:hypothetical protein [Bryobacteraceae bacterium]